MCDQIANKSIAFVKKKKIELFTRVEFSVTCLMYRFHSESFRKFANSVIVHLKLKTNISKSTTIPNSRIPFVFRDRKFLKMQILMFLISNKILDPSFSANNMSK